MFLYQADHAEDITIRSVSVYSALGVSPVCVVNFVQYMYIITWTDFFNRTLANFIGFSTTIEAIKR